MRNMAMKSKIIALLAVPGLCLAATKGPDSFGYQANDRATFSFADISGSGSASILAGADDDQVQLSLGFTFNFYGQSYTSVCVNSNGFLTLGNCNAALAAANFANQDLASVAPQGNLPMIAAYWTDLTFAAPGAGAVFYQTSGPVGARRFIVQWNQAYPQNGASGVTFQAILSEGSNQILVQYANTVAGVNGFDQGAGATVGIRDASGQTNGRNLEWSYNAPVIPSQTAIVFLPPSATYLLQTSANPPAAGSVTPSGAMAAGSVVAVTASPAAGYRFTSWSGDAAGTNNPVSVLMNGPRNVVANFQPSAGAPQLTLTSGAHSDGAQAGTRMVPMTLANAGTGLAASAQIVSITNITVLGGTGAVTVASAMPATVGDLSQGQSGTTNVVFNWPATATRVSMRIAFGANSGGYSNATTVTMFR
jgi:hypothetical protein